MRVKLTPPSFESTVKTDAFNQIYLIHRKIQNRVAFESSSDSNLIESDLAQGMLVSLAFFFVL